MVFAPPFAPNLLPPLAPPRPPPLGAARPLGAPRPPPLPPRSPNPPRQSTLVGVRWAMRGGLNEGNYSDMIDLNPAVPADTATSRDD